ncbi:MAG: M16 family metallopeptidase [Bacteroidales bacterium]
MRRFLFIVLLLLLCANAKGQKGVTGKYINLKEFCLDNGLTVLIHRDTTSPIVTVGTLYHVGGKNEEPHLTGFAHLTEHLFFHGTKNIPQGQFERIVREAGGYSNASTTSDRTFYYLIMPSNQLELAIWMESERMLHPQITREGFYREAEVVKEELRQRYQSGPLANAENEMMEFVFEQHPYKMPLIGYMEHLDSAKPRDFYDFVQKWYTPDNAALVLSGDIDIDSAKNWVDKYFSEIPASAKKPSRPSYMPGKEKVGKRAIRHKEGIKEPHTILSYRALAENSREADVLKFAINLLTDEKYGEVTLLPQKHDFIRKISLTPEFYEDAGMVWARGSYSGSRERFVAVLDSTFRSIAQNGIPQERINSLKRLYYNNYIDVFFSPATIAEMAATGKMLFGDSYFLLDFLHRIESITPQEICDVIGTCLNSGNSDILTYLPTKNAQQNDLQ